MDRYELINKIRKLWGVTGKTVRIQISAAIIAYCLVAIAQHNMKIKRPTDEVLQIHGISLVNKTSLRVLFDNTNFNNVKEQLYLLVQEYLINI